MHAQPPFTTVTFKVVVCAPAERADTVPLFFSTLSLFVLYSVVGKLNVQCTVVELHKLNFTKTDRHKKERVYLFLWANAIVPVLLSTVYTPIW